MTHQTQQKVGCKFIHSVKYYHNMWTRLSHTLEPLTNLMHNIVKTNQTDVKHNVFKNIDRSADHSNSFDYPGFD